MLPPENLHLPYFQASQPTANAVVEDLIIGLPLTKQVLSPPSLSFQLSSVANHSLTQEPFNPACQYHFPTLAYDYLSRSSPRCNMISLCMYGEKIPRPLYMIYPSYYTNIVS